MNSISEYHIPVLFDEAMKYLSVRPGGKYIDATIGGGGHTAGILARGGVVLGIDEDWEAIAYVEERQRLETASQKLILRQGNFARLQEIAKEAGFGKVAGVLFDLGVSSHQLETDYRGFSFHKDAPLDMRMDTEAQKVTAADLVNAGSKEELAKLFFRLGEERYGKRIARAIVAQRERSGRIETTEQLKAVVTQVRPKGNRDRTHPATRVFQALRIAVNDELASLEKALPQSLDILEPGGRLVVISFHSLEDRIVKNFMRLQARENMGILTNKVVVPTAAEVARNPRARSGKLRAAEKTVGR